MGLISRVLDAAVVAFSAAVAVAAPLIDAQALVPARLVPAPVAELRRRYAAEFGDYLVAELPLFFRGLVLVEIAFLWPLSLANLYGVLAGRRWASTTSLMAGVSTATSMAAILAELLGSGRASDKLLQMYVPFMVFALCAILRGLLPRPGRAVAAASHAPPARKKRA
uniref:EXPERA domain-containing protein n=1 Tax=Ananas comosus var. bracteatus TaxID=296719 RepID=A0A6V7NKX1_ANACO|nr:unnamed protein product [Ananas comosus var. bracteatus]